MGQMLVRKCLMGLATVAVRPTSRGLQVYRCLDRRPTYCRAGDEAKTVSGLKYFSISKISAIRTPISLVIGSDYEVFATPHGDIRNKPVLRPIDRSVPLRRPLRRDDRSAVCVYG
jgi:hypothetical protein